MSGGRYLATPAAERLGNSWVLRPDLAGSRNRQGGDRCPGTFPDECCFQVIYFNSNISFCFAIETGLTAGLETIRLRHAVKNAWVRRQTPISDRFALAFEDPLTG